MIMLYWDTSNEPFPEQDAGSCCGIKSAVLMLRICDQEPSELVDSDGDQGRPVAGDGVH